MMFIESVQEFWTYTMVVFPDYTDVVMWMIASYVAYHVIDILKEIMGVNRVKAQAKEQEN